MPKIINSYFLMNSFIITSIFLTSCNTGKLKVIADLPSSLKEISAVETISNSNLIWVIEDSGNKNTLYGLNSDGKIIKNLEISNATNIDWEDLTSDEQGNLYIADFGNNSKKRKDFSIYKIENPKNKSSKVFAEKINFNLPKSINSEDFEAFFIFQDSFYIFSKEQKKAILIKVPNAVGHHEAELVTEFNLDGKNNLITSADISSDGKTVILLNHDKLWKLSEYTSDNFLKGAIEEFNFDHNSQKEGICFKDENTIYITDERAHGTGGNLYELKFKSIPY
jgi:hypothetical protein